MEKKRIFISYTHRNLNFANELHDFLSDNISSNISILRDIKDLKPFMNLKEFMQRVKESDFTITLISQEYLKSRNCMYEICELIKEDQDIKSYLTKTLPIILPSALTNEWNIFDYECHYNYIEYWQEKLEKLENKLVKHESQIKNKRNLEFYETKRKKIIKDINWVLDIYKNIEKFLEDLTDTYCVPFEKIKAENYRAILEKIEPEEFEDYSTKVYLKPQLEEIYSNIIIRSNTNPNLPEFPIDNPKFPASNSKKIMITGYGEVIIKDESTNPTGTHKDRMAWEVIVYYKKIIESLLKKQKKYELPRLSIISSGSSAVALQFLLRKFRLPNLKVLIHNKFSNELYESLKKLGCKLYITDLSEKYYSSEEIKELTNNKNGIDITYRDIVDPQEYFYFDWLAYEILNLNPDYCFIPFGTGELFINILNVNKFECVFKSKDRRFSGNIDRIKNCVFIGVTSDKENTPFIKLYNPFFDINSFNKNQMNKYYRLNACNPKSTIRIANDEFLEEALSIAKQNNIQAEPSGLAGLVSFLEMKNEIPKNKNIVIINTGKVKCSKNNVDFIHC